MHLNKKYKYFKKLLKNGLNVLVSYKSSRSFSIYDISFRDAILHWHERNWTTPSLEIIDEDNIFYKLRIEHFVFYWPKGFKLDGLTWLFNEVFFTHKKNPASYHHEFVKIPDGGWVIDGGAGEGFFLDYAFQKNAGTVVAVEPIRKLCDALEKTFLDQRNHNRFTVISAGLGDVCKEGILNIDTHNAWRSYISHNAKTEGAEPVRVTTIDDVVKIMNLTGPGIIKMDIEGAEMDALKGAEETLSKFKPALAIAVYHTFEGARECAAIVKGARPDYKIEFRGMHGWYDGPPRPYVMFAW